MLAALITLWAVGMVVIIVFVLAPATSFLLAAVSAVLHITERRERLNGSGNRDSLG